MIAAVYCRKSTEQNGVADEHKSVTRQVEHARAYAVSKGWTIAEDHIYVDDGISGATFANRPGFVRLMNALDPKPPFDALIMSEESRIGREMIQVLSALLKLVTHNVRVFLYLTDTERTLDGPVEKAMLALQAMSDEMERSRAVQRTTDGMVKKFWAGHVLGGLTYGYDNVPVLGPDGARSYTLRRVNEAEAAVVLRIYEMYAVGAGLGTISQTLSNEHVPCPRARLGRDNGWSATSVREILKRPAYRGVDVWMRAKKSDRWGQKKTSRRPPSEWLRRDAPELRLVPPAIAAAVDARFASMRERTLRQSNGRLIGRPPGEGSPYLLTGLLTCGVCGGSMEVLSSCSSKKNSQRTYRYYCYNARRKGRTVCTNKQPAPMADADAAVLRAVERTMLHPDVVTKAIAYAEQALTADATSDERKALTAQLATVETAITRLTAAIANGAELTSIMPALDSQERQRTALAAKLEKLATPKAVIDRIALRRTLRGYLADWRGLLGGHVHQAQQILRRLIVGRLTMMPEAGNYYTFAGTGTVRPLLSGVIRNLASPTGFEPVFQP